MVRHVGLEAERVYGEWKGGWTCLGCGTQDRARVTDGCESCKRRKWRSDACPDCGAPKDRVSVRCWDCSVREKAARAGTSRRRRRTGEWACAGCGTTNAASATLGCKRCSDRLRRRKERRATCPECGGPMTKGHGRCFECRNAAMRAKTRCKRGHPFTPENTYVTPKGHRNCRTCRREPTFAWTRSKS